MDFDLAEFDLSQLDLEVDVQTVATIKDMEDVFVIDVREQWEYDEGHIPDITLIPMGDIPNRLSEIPTDKVADRSYKVILWQLQNLPKEIFGEKKITNTL